MISVVLGQVQPSAQERKFPSFQFFMTLPHKDSFREWFHTKVSVCLSSRHVLT